VLHLTHRRAQNAQAACADVKAEWFNAQEAQIVLEGSPADADLTLRCEEGHVR